MARRAKLLGKERVKFLFDSLTAEIKAEMTEATRVEAEALADAVRRAVPVKSGNLKRSVRVVQHQYKAASFTVKIGGVPGTRKKVRKGVSDSDFAIAKASGGFQGEFDYTMAVEFGHIDEDGKHVPAEPFAYPTYRVREKAMRTRIRARVRKIINTRFAKG